MVLVLAVRCFGFFPLSVVVGCFPPFSSNSVPFGTGKDLAAFGICVPYPVSYWIVISYSPIGRGWIKACLKLQRVSSLAVSTFLFYVYEFVLRCVDISVKAFVLPPEHIYTYLVCVNV